MFRQLRSVTPLKAFPTNPLQDHGARRDIGSVCDNDFRPVRTILDRRIVGFGRERPQMNFAVVAAYRFEASGDGQFRTVPLRRLNRPICCASPR
ncbi:MAG: hypothetical protein ACLSCF_03160 [Alistipes finegoldii]